MNKQIIHDALVLTAFTLVIGVILGAVYGITKAPIDKANEQTKKEAYQAVFADASGFNQQEYDADAADKMVADAGYDDTIDDVEQAVEVVVEQLKAVGINATIDAVEWNTWLEDVYTNREYQATISGITCSDLTPGYLLNRFQTESKKNFVNFKSTEIGRAHV